MCSSCARSGMRLPYRRPKTGLSKASKPKKTSSSKILEKVKAARAKAGKTASSKKTNAKLTKLIRELQNVSKR